MEMAQRPRVCVIGAGLSGLATIKECLSEGFDVYCFEARPEIGGQWAHQADTSDPKLQSSVYDGVILNSCRDTSSFPDFPLDPARYGDYFSHRKYLQYIHEYADHFGLKRHIRLRTRVLESKPRPDGTWSVRIQEEGKVAEDLEFGVVLTCIGHLSTPYTPDFKGLETFKGQLLHSHYYRRPGPFEGKRVALIGFGSSAVDIACEIAPQAQELHLVTRRGGWVLPRYVLGLPSEAWDNRATQVWVPQNIGMWLQTQLLYLIEGKPPKEMVPDHKLLNQSPTIRGDFLEKVRTGIITIQRSGVESITETGVQLSNGTFLDVDVIIMCTGYNQLDFPFLPPDVVRGPETMPNRIDLYKLMVPPKYPNLYMMGLCELVGPAAPAFDAQARWVVAHLSGRLTLPSTDEMYKGIREFQEWQKKHFVDSERHATAFYVIQYVDDLLKPLGAVPGFAKLLGKVFTSGHPWRALKVLNAVWFGIPAAAQWRLCGYGSKEKLATATVLRTAAGDAGLSETEKQLLETSV